MTKFSFSNVLFNKVTEFFMPDISAEAEERYRLVMTEAEWAMATANWEEPSESPSDGLAEFEFRNYALACMQGDLSDKALPAEEAETLKQCIEEMEQMPSETVTELLIQLTRWRFETVGLPYIPDDQVCHPPGVEKDVRLVDCGGLRISEGALKQFIINPPPSDAPQPPRLTDEQLGYINDYIQENCPELGVATHPKPIIIE